MRKVNERKESEKTMFSSQHTKFSNTHTSTDNKNQVHTNTHADATKDDGNTQWQRKRDKRNRIPSKELKKKTNW